nr:hypothetical protein [Mammaliicoccus sp. Marseille-Q6498]
MWGEVYNSINNDIESYIDIIKSVLGVISLIVVKWVTILILNKIKSIDFIIDWSTVSFAISPVILIYLFVELINIKLIKDIIFTNDIILQLLISMFALIIIVLPIALIFANFRNFIMLKNKFYIYKESNDNKYKFIVKGYRELKKDFIEIAPQNFYENREGFDIINKDEKLESRYFENKITMFNKIDKYIDFIVLERKNPIRTWFKINAWKYSILGSLPIVIYSIFILSLNWITNEYYIIILLTLITSYAMVIQIFLTARINQENRNFKSSYLENKNNSPYFNKDIVS